MENIYEKRIKMTAEIASKIALVDEFKGFWKGAKTLSPYTLKKLQKSVIVTSTGASTRIEGSIMTDKEVEKLLASLKSTPPTNRDEEEVAGYADLLNKIFEGYEKIPITEGVILQFHEILLHYAKKDHDHKGKYKNRENKVASIDQLGNQKIIFEPTEPWLVKKEMDDVLFWIREAKERNLHPLLIIASFIFEFLAIHPFTDGNGRTSRALTNLMLLHAGYDYIKYVSLEEIIEEQRPQYYDALRKTQKVHKTEKADITPWLIFMLDTLIEQTKRAKEILLTDNPIDLLSEKHKQVFEIFTSKEFLFGVQEIANKTHLPEQTIKQSLRKLLSLHLIERIGLGRATKYQKL
ncbi:MAG: Filamentation induced by cAMP protein Fic [Candidatus Nomurabacteria bacterium GW2011_GWA2_40_9]|uniref:Filamentation induced by cAMP protein Fic n=1 Tax=Candidatus Nomurabacteria bacterium GW2011_GWA2_40_9 TaxID=1618734 RepID=A0A0G0TY39_9BACT|nr:MAG: Filamentation induced by cAMP protein Fic [Candidatus Nomurabacteria bacterium GW2011_GWA2_40_9]